MILKKIMTSKLNTVRYNRGSSLRYAKLIVIELSFAERPGCLFPTFKLSVIRTSSIKKLGDRAVWNDIRED